MIWVDGRIIAEGTEQDSIVFDRIQDDVNYNWGCIFITENAELSVFKHCKVENANGIGVSLGIVPKGISFRNGIGIVTHCTFVNNGVSISSESYDKELEITNNEFIINEDINPFYPSFNYGKMFMETVLYGDDASKKSLVCNNKFYSIEAYRCIHSEFINFCYNKVINCSQSSNKGIGHFYGNEFINCEIGITNITEEDSLFIKKNRFIGGDDGIDVDYAYVEISDNYFEGCDLYSDINNSGKAFNNIAINGRLRLPGYLEVNNNSSFNGTYVGVQVSWRNINCNNNMIVNNEYAIGSGGQTTYNNCIFINNIEINDFPISDNPIFRNCILDFELPEECIDGGGNIWVDSLQTQQLFVDIENGDFHLAPGSIAIDAGFDTLDYYYPFDMDYNQRIWDGDNDGNAIIDIGPYEYGAPQFGKITGFITETNSGDFVDYVLIKIDNEPGNFTFADSVGYFEIQLPAGTYDIYAERVFYEDNIIYSVTVEDEQNTEIAFNMTSTLPQVSSNEDIIQSSIDNIQLSNYPNPFNSSTTISFSLTQNSDFVNLDVFNIKGQKVITLINEKMLNGKHSIIWSGVDDNNKPVGSGIYFYKLKTYKKEFVKRMILLK